MNHAKLGYTDFAVRSNRESQMRGTLLRTEIEELVANGRAPWVAQFLHASFQIPCSKSTYMALTKVPPKKFKFDAWLELQVSNMRKTTDSVVVPNFGQRLSQTAISEFQKFCAGKMKLDLGPFSPFTGWNAQNTFEALEAVLLDYWPPGYIAVSGRRFNVVQPSVIDLGPKLPAFTAITATFKRKKQSLLDELKAFASQLRKLRKARRGTAAAELVQSTVAAWRNDENEIYQKLAAVLVEIYINPPNNSNRLGQSSDRLVRAIERVIRKQLGSTPYSLSGAEKAVASSIAQFIEELPNDTLKSLSEAVGDIEEVEIHRSSYALSPPSYYENLYGYNPRNPPFNASIEIRALHCLKMLSFQCGRRATCYRGLRLRNFFLLRDANHRLRTAAVYIEHSKTLASSRNRLPLDYLLPETELEHLADFIHSTRGLDPETYLLDLAGVGNPELMEPDVLQTRLSAALGKAAGCPRLPTHVPRITWATWFPIRAMCVWNPILLEFDCLECVRDHVWFQPEALDSLRKGLISPSVDVVEFARRVLGHANTYQFLASYCRSWPLQILCYRALIENLNRRSL